MRRGVIESGNRLATLLLVTLAGCGGGRDYADRTSWDDGPPIEWGEDEFDEEQDESERIEDGIHSATVDYYNPETGYSATYDLDVDVAGGEVSTIYFPNDGYLDDSHIYPGELDEDGRVRITDDQGREFEVEVNP